MAQNKQERREAAMKGVQDAMKSTRGLQREVSALNAELDTLSRQRQYLEGKAAGRSNTGVEDGIAQIDARLEELTGIRAEQSEALTNAQSEQETWEGRLDRVVKNIEDDAGNSDDAT